MDSLRLCNGVNTAPKYGLQGLIPCCRSRLRTVCELILRNPCIPAAVVDAATIRFRRWKTRMYRSSSGVVMRGLPLLWRSFVELVCWNLFHSLEMLLWLTFRVRATSFWDSPAWRYFEWQVLTLAWQHINLVIKVKLQTLCFYTL